MKWWSPIIAACLLTGCTRSNMDSQPRYDSFEPGPLFQNGQTLQKTPQDAIARNADETDDTRKPTLDAALMQRGEERYNIFCSPCHDRVGNGQGMIVKRGMPQPPSLHDDRLRQADDQHFFDVITHGYGAMYAFNDRINPKDRWAIVAYLRALQLSQNAKLADLTPQQASSLGSGKSP